jgi:hypothetical protein
MNVYDTMSKPSPSSPSAPKPFRHRSAPIPSSVDRHDATDTYDIEAASGPVYRCVEWRCEDQPIHAHSKRPYLA